MAFSIRCKTCQKISKSNYLHKPVVAKKKEFQMCLSENHIIKIEKVY